METFVIDVSRNNPLTDDQLKELVDNGLIGMVIKFTQGNYRVDSEAANKVDQARRLGVPYVGYHWSDPIYPVNEQVQYFHEAVKKFEPSGVAHDMEQYWLSWEEWWKVVVLRQPGYVRPFSQDQLARFYTNYMKEAKKVIKDLPHMGYSAKWFIDGYCRALGPAIHDNMDAYWNASWLYWDEVDNDPTLSFAELQSTLKRAESYIKLTKLPNGIYSWGMWQIGISNLKGYPKIDIDVVTPAVFEMFFGEPPEPSDDDDDVSPPDETTPEPGLYFEVIAEKGLNVRNAPSTSGEDLGDIMPGEIVTPYDVGGSNAWIKIDPDEEKWCCVQLRNARYADALVGVAVVEPEDPVHPPDEPEGDWISFKVTAEKTLLRFVGADGGGEGQIADFIFEDANGARFRFNKDDIVMADGQAHRFDGGVRAFRVKPGNNGDYFVPDQPDLWLLKDDVVRIE